MKALMLSLGLVVLTAGNCPAQSSSRFPPFPQRPKLFPWGYAGDHSKTDARQGGLQEAWAGTESPYSPIHYDKILTPQATPAPSPQINKSMVPAAPKAENESKAPAPLTKPAPIPQIDKPAVPAAPKANADEKASERPKYLPPESPGK